ncbi:uncharacterized protein PAC_15653 [Phialocephala subalpina]|uniref:F-box domain-containing protein n=1 Tax=Phialocephala subalpina TaxID=576137 RepID=A0A1L7XL59_9HELO|nr:uncharacterized protein PAC_15653 [Phialocephala subalpina]
MLVYELDEDVLRIIVYLLSSRRIDVVHLALTCRALYAIAKRPNHLEIKLGSPQLQLLKRTLHENPGYGHLVQTLIFRTSGHSHQGEPHLDLHAFLQHLPNLQALKANTNMTPLLLSTLLSRDLKLRNTLRNIEIYDPSPDADKIFELICLPRLRRLKLRSPSKSLFSKPSITSISNPRTNFLELDLSCCDVNSQLVSEIFKHCRSLTAFSCILPFRLSTDNGIRRWFSPARCIEPVLLDFDKLTHLNLCIHTNIGLEHDQSRLDLSGFVALKSLVARAELFVAELGGKVSRDGLHTLFPRSLENLQLSFGFGTGIFYHLYPHYPDRNNKGRQRFIDNEIDPSSYQWITELAEHKSEYFPFLREIELRETIKGAGMKLWVEEWDLPLDVAGTFDEADVELRVLVRVETFAGQKQQTVLPTSPSIRLSGMEGPTKSIEGWQSDPATLGKAFLISVLANFLVHLLDSLA